MISNPMQLLDPHQFRQLFGAAKSLAVVGNAPTILQYEHGDKIDAQDIVVRFNRATTTGHESKIGTRTDILVVNASNSKKMAPPPSETLRPRCMVAFVSPQGLPNVDVDAFADWVGDTPILFMFGPDILGTPSALRTRPLTSGTYFLYMALRLLTFERLFVTGFTMFGAVEGGAGKFYQDNRPGLGLFHDLDAEEVIFSKILADYAGELTATEEVLALLKRNRITMRGTESAMGASTKNSFGKKLAASLSWRLMAWSMRLRRMSET
jgi:hypothetical protein